MSFIEFSKQEKETIARKVQMYFREELEQEIGQFDAEFLLDFFAEEIGAYFYNRGLQDANTVLMDRLDNITEAIDEIQKPTDFIK
ncbi:DUF2164 domain-containing protein [Aurantivibrio infirmus]